jgi:hypothetical protein
LVGKDSAKDFFHLIDDRSLLNKTDTATPKIDKSVLEELIERHGLEIDEEQEVPLIQGESFDDRTKRLMTFAKKVHLMAQRKSGVQ